MDRVRVDVVYALILDDAGEKVLMVQDNGEWSLPGGAREVGEMLEQAAVREAKEETGFDVAVGGIVHVSEKVIGAHHALFVTFCGAIVRGNAGSNDPEIGGIEWKTIAEAEQLLPFYRDLRSLFDQAAHYQVETESCSQ